MGSYSCPDLGMGKSGKNEGAEALKQEGQCSAATARSTGIRPDKRTEIISCGRECCAATRRLLTVGERILRRDNYQKFVLV